MTSSRIAMRLALGIVCGIALVLLPAVFSAGTSTESKTGSDLPALVVHPPQPSQLTNGPAALYGTLGSGSAGLSFLSIILFILLPSTVFSFVVRRWAEKRVREYL